MPCAGKPRQQPRHTGCLALRVRLAGWLDRVRTKRTAGHACRLAARRSPRSCADSSGGTGRATPRRTTPCHATPRHATPRRQTRAAGCSARTQACPWPLAAAEGSGERAGRLVASFLSMASIRSRSGLLQHTAGAAGNAQLPARKAARKSGQGGSGAWTLRSAAVGKAPDEAWCCRCAPVAQRGRGVDAAQYLEDLFTWASGLSGFF